VLEIFESLRVYLLIILYFLDSDAYGLLDEFGTPSIAQRVSHPFGSAVGPEA